MGKVVDDPTARLHPHCRVCAYTPFISDYGSDGLLVTLVHGLESHKVRWRQRLLDAEAWLGCRRGARRDQYLAPRGANKQMVA